MLDPSSKKDIEKVSLEILRSSKSLDVFPTPIEKIAAYSELIVRKDIDVSVVHDDYLFKATDALKRALSKVRGMFDRKEKTIFLDLSLKKERRNFVQLHEIAHGVLPWQTNIHDLLDDDDDSLNDHTYEEFEIEANYFASITLFQHDRFIDELNKYSLSIESSIQLAKHFGASVHASLRKYIECSKNRCALIVLENITKKGTFPKCNIKDKFQSEKFNETFGELIIPNELGYKWIFVQDYYHQRRFKTDGLISIDTCNGIADFNYHFFNNTYNAFVFLFPIGEKKSSRKRIIITDTNL